MRQVTGWLLVGGLAGALTGPLTPLSAADAPMPSTPEVAATADEQAGQADDTSTKDARQQVYTLDGVIGQVNGRPIYARTVFAPIEDRLHALARQTSRTEFRQEAARLIAAQLNQIVTDALVLGAAERDLSEQERLGLRHMLRQRREELIRQHGQGSLALTESALQRETGKGLEATLEEFRQEVLIQRYLRQQLFPRINVTRRDTRRYYYENLEEFQPTGQRVIELLRLREPDQVEQITSSLAGGVPFAEVSPNVRRLNAPGKAPLAHAPLNEALAHLKQGEHAGPIEAGDSYWFIHVAELDRAEARSFVDAQREIENRLRNQQFRQLSEQHRRDLFTEGSYNPLDQMTEALLEIAMSRYAPQQ